MITYSCCSECSFCDEQQICWLHHHLRKWKEVRKVIGLTSLIVRLSMVPRKLLNEPQPYYRAQHDRQQDDMFFSVTVVFHWLLWLDSCWANCPMIGGRTEGGYRKRTLHITAKDVGEMWLKSVNSLLFSELLELFYVSWWTKMRRSAF